MNIQTGKIYKFIENSVSCDFCDAGLKPLNKHYHSMFRNSFFSLFSVVEKGDVRSILKTGRGRIEIKRPEKAACYIPREMYAKTILCTPEADIRWSRINYTIFGNLDVLDFFDIPFVFDSKTSEKILEINLALSNLTNEHESIRGIVKRKKLSFEMLDLILSISPLKNESAKKLIAIEELIPVINYINENYAEKLPNSKLTELTHLSESRFCHKFKEFIGQSPQQYIQQLRFFQASKQLASTNLRISEVAEQHGFHDQFHFSRTFKVATGHSPLQYRKRIKNSQATLFSH